jgi:hypothetical protein
VNVPDPVVTLAGLNILTARAGKVTGAQSLAGTMRLFTSDQDVLPDSVAADFTEATFVGYARIVVGEDSWQPAALDGSTSVAPNTGNPFEWMAGSAETVQGWLYVLDSGELLAGQHYTDAHDLVAGAVLQIAASLTGDAA